MIKYKVDILNLKAVNFKVYTVYCAPPSKNMAGLDLLCLLLEYNRMERRYLRGRDVTCYQLWPV